MAEETEESPASQTSIGVLFSKFSNQISLLIRGEIALAKAQVKQLVTSFGAGVVALVVAGVFALFGLGWLLTAMFFGWLALTGASWAAALLTALVIFVVTLLLALIGMMLIKRGKASVPNPKDGLKSDVAVIKAAVKKGGADE